MFSGALRVFNQGHSNEVPLVIQGCFKCVLRNFQSGFNERDRLKLQLVFLIQRSINPTSIQRQVNAADITFPHMPLGPP